MSLDFSTSKKGFTLIELMVAIAIIGILTGIIIGSLTSARAKGRDAKRISDIKNIELALKLYNADNPGTYPRPPLSTTLAPVYIATIPKDPYGQDYNYIALGSGATCYGFHLGASLEDSNGVLSDDADTYETGGTCNNQGSATEFHGLSPGTGSPAVCGTVAGTAAPGGTERCFDVRY